MPEEFGLLEISVIIVGVLIILVSIAACVISVMLTVRYIKFNRTKNQAGLKGKEVARRILDSNGLNDIKIVTWGSGFYGNSYSHYFKKIRLRRLMLNKDSITSMGMSAEKACLAILDKEDDPDMKKRVRLLPLITFGPFLCVPLIIIGVLIDIFLLNSSGVVSLVVIILSLLLYFYSFILSVKVLVTEKKAEKRALEILKAENMANDEELEMINDLYKLYNLEYINEIIMELLRMIWYILKLVLQAKSSSQSSSRD